MVSSAKEAGLLSGDIITKVNDKTVTYTTDKEDRTTLKTNMIAKNPDKIFFMLVVSFSYILSS